MQQWSSGLIVTLNQIHQFQNILKCHDCFYSILFEYQGKLQLLNLLSKEKGSLLPLQFAIVWPCSKVYIILLKSIAS